MPVALGLRAGRQLLNEARGQLIHSGDHNVLSQRFHRRQFFPAGKLGFFRARSFLCFRHSDLLVQIF